MGGFKFNTGLRTDGREVRPHKPWQLNTGRETGNRTVATNPGTPRTNFNLALKPRLGGPEGPLAPITRNVAGNSVGPLAPSNRAAQETARRATELASPLWAAYRPATPTPAQPGVAAGEDQVAQLGSFLNVPSDAPPTPSMFANVSDTGAEPVQNTAQKWKQAGIEIASGSRVTDTPETGYGTAGTTIQNKYGFATNVRPFARADVPASRLPRLGATSAMSKEDQPY